MKFTSSVAAVVCVCLLVGAAQAKIETEDEVLVITKDNFDEALEKYPYILFEFYAPWCGHCKALAPAYAKAAKELLESNPDVKLAKVDATIETELAEKHNVRGYPTLTFYRKGSALEYTGGRKAEDIVNWVLKKTGPAVKPLTTVDEAKAFIDANTVVVVGFFKDPESEKAKIFLEVGNQLHESLFGIISNDDIISEYKAEDGKIYIFKKFDDNQVEFTEELNIKNLKNFIQVESLPLIVEFNQDTARKIFNGDVKSHLLIFLSKEAGHFEKYVDDLKAPAKEFRDKILFVTIDADVNDHERILEFFGMKKENVPAIRLIKLEEEMVKFKPENPDLTAENAREFVSNYLEGKLKKHMLTQDLPEDWDKNPVKVLVSTNFVEVAYDKSKKVLVEFYAPWCGHCKQLVPIYEELAEHYKDDDSVVIAKMDATVNELEDVKIINYPTIILYKAESNKGIKYMGPRTLADLMKFVDTDGAEGEGVEEAEEEDEDDDAARKDEL